MSLPWPARCHKSRLCVVLRASGILVQKIVVFSVFSVPLW